MKKSKFKFCYSSTTLPLENEWVQGWQKCDSGLDREAILKKYSKKLQIIKKGRSCPPPPPLPNAQGADKYKVSVIYDQ
jgi:hypothetical protein